MLRRLRQDFRQYPEVDVIYDDEGPFDKDIVLDLIVNGIRLHFDPEDQRLKLIDVYDPTRMSFAFKHDDKTLQILDAQEGDHVLQDVLNFIPPTYQSSYNATTGHYVLHPSIGSCWFLFPVPKECRRAFEHKDMDRGLSSYSDGSVPVLSSFKICNGTLARIEGCRSELGCVDYHVGTGALHLSWTNHQMFMGSSCQDAISEFGPPQHITYVEGRASPDSGSIDTPASDYFFNYFDLGLDIMFDGKDNRAKKFVLHTNFPGHYDFSRYVRCNFRVCLPRASQIKEPLRALDTTVITQQPRRQPFREPDLDMDEPPEVSITADKKWSEIKGIVGTCALPMTLHRAPAINTVDPFGDTLLYKTANLVFEIMPNDHIATLTILPIGH